jgi:hypothetical protein
MWLGNCFIMMNHLRSTQCARLRAMYENDGRSLHSDATALLEDPPAGGLESQQEMCERLHRSADKLNRVPLNAIVAHKLECKGCACTIAEIARDGLPYPVLGKLSESVMINVLEQILVDRKLFDKYGETPGGVELARRRGCAASECIYVSFVTVGSGAEVQDGTINYRKGLVGLFAHMCPWDTAGFNRWSRLGRTKAAGKMLQEIIDKSLGVFCWGELAERPQSGQQQQQQQEEEFVGSASSSCPAPKRSRPGTGVALAEAGTNPNACSVDAAPTVLVEDAGDVIDEAEAAVLAARGQLERARQELPLLERATSVLEELAALTVCLRVLGQDAEDTSVAARTLSGVVLPQDDNGSRAGALVGLANFRLRGGNRRWPRHFGVGVKS